MTLFLNKEVFMRDLTDNGTIIYHMLDLLQQKTVGFLRWSEKYTKTDMVYLASGGFWLVAAQILTALSGFALAIVFANLLPKEVYGNYRFVLSVAGIFTLTNLSGLNTALTRAVARGYHRALVPIFKARVLWGLLGGGASLATGIYYFAQGNSLLAAAFIVVAFLIPLSDSSNVYEAYRMGLKDFRYIATADVIVRIVSVAMMVTALMLVKNVAVLVGVYFLSYMLPQYVFFLHARHDAERAKSTELDAHSVIKYGKHLSVVYIIGSFAAQIDKIVVFHYVGAVALAAYAFAIVIPDQLRAFTNNITILGYPKFVIRPLPEVFASMKRKSFVLGSVVAVICRFILNPNYEPRASVRRRGAVRTATNTSSRS
jgi:O-antigen/teichoic acid export membrane protein